MHSSNVAQPCAADVESGLSVVSHNRHSGTEDSATPVAVSWWTTTVATVVAVNWLSQMATNVLTQMQWAADYAMCYHHHSGYSTLIVEALVGLAVAFGTVTVEDGETVTDPSRAHRNPPSR
eukprot:5790654-Amphidinium_carterae.2